MWPYSLSCTLADVRTCTCYVRASTTTRTRLYYDMCTPLLRHVRASTSTSMYVHICDQDDNATYASTRWVPTVRHFLACEDVAGGSHQSRGRIVLFCFCPDALPCVRRCSWWVPAVRGVNCLFFCPDALPCVRRCSWWVPAVRGKRFFLRNTVARPVGPRCQVEE